MAIPVLILGQSGTGKSYSMKNFNESDICLISVQKSLLPFRKKFAETIITDDYKKIGKAMKSTTKKVIVIDDTQYLMANEFMRRATERGYDKFTEMAKNFWSLIVEEINELPQDTIVYLMCHTSQDENGVEKMKTIGKLMDEKITPEGLFMIVLKTTVSDGKYAFVTQNNGKDTVKSPEGMFTSYAINNDLKYVDDKIRNYYDLTGGKTDEEMKEADAEAVADVEAPKDRSERKRERRKAADIAEAVEEAKAEISEEKKPLRQRKSREEVQSENAEKVEAYEKAKAEALNEAFGDADEVPFEEAVAVTDNVPAPNLEPVPRRRRRQVTE